MVLISLPRRVQVVPVELKSMKVRALFFKCHSCFLEPLVKWWIAGQREQTGTAVCKRKLVKQSRLSLDLLNCVYMTGSLWFQSHCLSGLQSKQRIGIHEEIKSEKSLALVLSYKVTWFYLGGLRRHNSFHHLCYSKNHLQETKLHSVTFFT